MKKNFWKNKKILITGHTGFKGSWLSIILHLLGSNVYGISLSPYRKIDLFNFIKNKVFKKSFICDLNNFDKSKNIIKKIKPDIIFHFASQSLVKNAYDDPHYTFKNNFNITLNILELLKDIKNIRLILISTTDKVYKISANKQKKNLFREQDEIGANDPYSSSKSCVELLISSYKKILSKDKNNCKILVARAGNVIGGGDWSDHRLLPDIMRSWKSKKTLKLRNPNATRPWQHVLDVLNGYMHFVEYAYDKKKYISILNFGPQENGISVSKIILFFKKNINQNLKINISKNSNFSETNKLNLDTNLTKKILKFKTRWKIKNSLKETFSWYIDFLNKKNPYRTTVLQIKKYFKDEI